MTKFDWERVNIENLDELRKSQGYNLPDRPSDDVATSRNGMEWNLNPVPQYLCLQCGKTIAPGEKRRHILAKHGSQILLFEAKAEAKRKKKRNKNKKLNQTTGTVTTCKYCGKNGIISKRHRRKCSGGARKYAKCEYCRAVVSINFMRTHKALCGLTKRIKSLKTP